MKTGNKLLKLWLLTPQARYAETAGRDSPDNAWNPWNRPSGMTKKVLVRAYTEEEAREYAQAQAGLEQRADLTQLDVQIWKSEQYTLCTEVMKYGRIGAIMIENS